MNIISLQLRNISRSNTYPPLPISIHPIASNPSQKKGRQRKQTVSLNLIDIENPNLSPISTSYQERRGEKHHTSSSSLIEPPAILTTPLLPSSRNLSSTRHLTTHNPLLLFLNSTQLTNNPLPLALLHSTPAAKSTPPTRPTAPTTTQVTTVAQNSNDVQARTSDMELGFFAPEERVEIEGLRRVEFVWFRNPERLVCW